MDNGQESCIDLLEAGQRHGRSGYDWQSQELAQEANGEFAASAGEMSLMRKMMDTFGAFDLKMVRRGVPVQRSLEPRWQKNCQQNDCV